MLAKLRIGVCDEIYIYIKGHWHVIYTMVYHMHLQNLMGVPFTFHVYVSGVVDQILTAELAECAYIG